MPTESELRDALHASANVTNKIDSETILRRARARRTPKQFAVTSISALAIVGVVVLGVNTLPALLPGNNAASDAGMMASVPQSEADAPVGGSEEKLVGPREASANLCGEPTTSVSENPQGLTLTVHFPDTAALTGGEVDGTVVLTNTGTKPVSGTTAPSPTIAVSRNGITVWHSNEMLVTVVTPVSLAPGQSLTFEARFTPRECGPEDDANGQFRDNLPLLAAGTYHISAVLTLVLDDATAAESILVGGSAATIELQ